MAETKAADAAQRRRVRQEQGEAIDALFGYPRLEDQYSQMHQNAGSDVSGMKPRRGWLFQMLATTVRPSPVLYGFRMYFMIFELENSTQSFFL